ncbi:MAG: hypothetical protein AAB400_02200 [Patescibacteria group bacterium]
MSNDVDLLNHVLFILKRVAERGDLLVTEIEMISWQNETNADLRMALHRRCTQMLAELLANLKIHLLGIANRALRHEVSKMVGELSDAAKEVLDNQDATSASHRSLWIQKDSQRDAPYRIEEIIQHIERHIELKRTEVIPCPECGEKMERSEDRYTCRKCGGSYEYQHCPHCKKIIRPS